MKAFLRTLGAPGRRARRPGLPANVGKRWSSLDDQRLARKFEAGHSFDELALAHERTRKAVRARLRRLGKLAAT